jgi:hypothetical protein
MKIASIRFLACSLAIAFPVAASAVDYPIPAKTQLIRQDINAGFIAKRAKIVNKPASGVFTMPSQSPTTLGAKLRFFKAGSAGPWPQINLPAGQWIALAALRVPRDTSTAVLAPSRIPACPCRSDRR